MTLFAEEHADIVSAFMIVITAFGIVASLMIL